MNFAPAQADPRLGLIDNWQRDFPLCPRPFARLGEAHDLSEREVISILREMLADDRLSRVGAVIRPNSVGASTLAAMNVPEEQLDEVAELVNAEPGVNHNYEREHALNLWFVVAAANSRELAATLNHIARATGIEVISLPLERAYHIDLGFPLDGRGNDRRGAGSGPALAEPDEDDRKLLRTIEDGLPLGARPYAEVALRLGWSEAAVLSRLARLNETGIISRFGCIVRHRRLGFTANAMVGWSVPEARVDAVGDLVARHNIVTLCYRRTRRPPAWNHNLFAMIHGRERAEVEAAIEDVTVAAGLDGMDRDILFSRRCFKQRGARYSPARAGAA
jgi:DNA-binding Lrp family transcriptional regulator